MAIEAEADKAAAEAARVEADLKREAAAEAEREAAVEAARARERQARHRSRSPEHHRHERYAQVNACSIPFRMHVSPMFDSHGLCMHAAWGPNQRLACMQHAHRRNNRHACSTAR